MRKTFPYPTTPQAAADAFYDAFRALDLEAMAALWGDGPDVVCIHPGAPPHYGRDQVMGGWERIFAGAEPPEIQLAEPRLVLDATVGGQARCAVQVVRERLRPLRPSHPGQGYSEVWATNVFRLGEAGWRIVLHHGSRAPLTGPGPGPSATRH